MMRADTCAVLQGFKKQKGRTEITSDDQVDFISYAREQFQRNGLDEEYLSPNELQYVHFVFICGTSESDDFIRLRPLSLSTFIEH